MGQKFLIDTNVAIHFMDGNASPATISFLVPALRSDVCAFSVISKMEILGFNFPNDAREQLAQRFINIRTVLPLTDDIVYKTIALRKASPKTKLPDAIIAATALAHGLTLLTRNTGDFSKIGGLEMVNPFEL